MTDMDRGGQVSSGPRHPRHEQGVPEGELGGWVIPDYGEPSEGVAGTFGRLTLFTTATPKSRWLAPTQRHITSNRSGWGVLGGTQ